MRLEVRIRRLYWLIALVNQTFSGFIPGDQCGSKTPIQFLDGKEDNYEELVKRGCVLIQNKELAQREYFEQPSKRTCNI